jgi:hypothetical protein
MPRRVIKQPNGKLAIFSTIVDHVVYYDCTPDEAIELIIQEDRLCPDDARVKVQRGIDDLDPYTGKPGDGHQRWDDDMFQMLIIHGGDSMDQKVLAECGMESDEIERWIKLARQARQELEETGSSNIHARYNDNQA